MKEKSKLRTAPTSTLAGIGHCSDEGEEQACGLLLPPVICGAVGCGLEGGKSKTCTAKSSLTLRQIIIAWRGGILRDVPECAGPKYDC